ncbi:MAG TPA: translocation/assembly module TamB domain-containing protein [Acidobacteriota bacterium]|nr:translocation/assembly module TamB domain-containing protein [Acidobacteriota bacterium]HQM63580.1 translocation/assembly module TamB domain-containing protein [Acidobacteriota bacterium]
MSESPRKKFKVPWPVRLLVYAALVTAATWWFLNSPLLKSVLLNAVNSRLAKETGLQLVVRDWDYNLFRGTVQARELAVVSPSGSFFCRIPELRLALDPGDMLQGRLTPVSLEVIGLDLVLNLPAEDLTVREREPSGELDLKFQSIILRRCRVRCRDVSIPLDGTIGRFDLRIDKDRRQPGYQVRLDVADAVFRQDRRRLPLDTFSLRGTVTADELEFREIAIASPLLEWRGALRLKTEAPLQLAAEGKGTIGLGLARLLEPDLPVELGGRVALAGRVAVRDGVLADLAAELSAPALAVNQVSMTNLFVQVAMRDGELVTDTFQFSLDGGGAVTGQWGYSPESRAIRYAGRLANLELGQFHTGGLINHPVDGVIDGELELGLAPGGSPKIRWDGVIAGMSVQLPSKAHFYRAEFIQGRLALDDGEISFELDNALGEGMLIQGKGRVRDGEVWVDPMRVWVPAEEEAQGLLARVARLSDKLKAKLDMVQIYGQTEFTGRLHLKGSFPDVDGQLSVGGLDMAGVRWRDVRLPFQLDRNSLRVRGGVLDGTNQRAGFDLNLRLEPDTHLDAISVDCRALDWQSLERTLEFVGLEFGASKPSAFLRGNLTGALNLALPEGQPGEGSWDIRIGGVRLKNQPLGLIQATGRLAGDVAHFDQLAIRGPAVDLSAGGSWNTDTNQVEAAGALRRLALKDLPQLRDAGVEGTLAGTFELRGRLSQPEVAATFTSDRLMFQGEPFGDLNLVARYEGDKVYFSLRTDYRENKYQTLGVVTLGAEPILDGRVFLDDVQIQPFLRQAGVPHADETRGTVTGEMFVTYPFNKPEEMEVTARFDEIGLTFRHLQLRNSQPVTLQVLDRRLTLRNTELQLNAAKLAIQGELSVFPFDELRVFVGGTLKADLLQPFYPELFPAGTVKLQATVQGKVGNPTVSGRVEFQDAALKIRKPELALSKINGVLELSRHSIRTERIQMDSTYGPLEIHGECRLDQLEPVLWNVYANSDRLSVPFPKGFLSEVSGRLHLQGRPGRSVLGGDLWIERAAPLQNVDLVGFVQLLAGMEFSSGGNGSGKLFTETTLNLNLKGERSVRIETDSLDIIGSVDLQIKGSLDQPVVRGALVVNNGEIMFRMNRFTVDRGLISFINPAEVDPELNLQISSDIKDYHIIVRLEGSTSRMKTQLVSVPNLSAAEIVQLITSGQAPESTSRAQVITPSGADYSAVLSQLVSVAVEQRLKQVVGFDTISVDAQLSDTDSASSTRVTVGKQVVKDLFVTYSRSVSSSEKDMIVIEYRLSPRVTIVATEDERGYFGLDFRFKRKF